MLNLPHNFLKNITELEFISSFLYDLFDFNLLFRSFPRLKQINYIFPCLLSNNKIFLTKSMIMSTFFICSSLKNAESDISIQAYAQFDSFYCQDALCMFRIKSVVGRFFTTHLYGGFHSMEICLHRLCLIPPAAWLEDLWWFADMSSTELEAHLNKYWFNIYLYQECLSVVKVTTHLSTITITSTLQCPQSTVALLHHILHSNLLPCTATSLNLTHTSSTIVHHLQSALSHNHQLICWRTTDCSLSLRTRPLPLPFSFLQWKSKNPFFFHSLQWKHH